MGEQRIVFASDLGRNRVFALLQRIKAGETVTDEERLGAIKVLMATSVRDWSYDPELWTLWQLAFFEQQHFEEPE